VSAFTLLLLMLLLLQTCQCNGLLISLLLSMSVCLAGWGGCQWLAKRAVLNLKGQRI
jgi:hypothetical protein